MLMKYLYDPPLLIKRIFKDFSWQTSNNNILLTLDDGPNPKSTEKILILLSKLNIKALFFLVGKNVERNSEWIKNILIEGHTIGNHTFNHKIITGLNRIDSIEEINRFNSLMIEKYNYKVKYFRPPFGRINFKTKKLMNETGMKCVMWNLLTYDYKKDIKKVKFSVDNYLQINSIIVLHDSSKTEDIIENSIKYIAEAATKNGIDFGVPEECLK
ncbi:MAG: polysaccharide deacetylase family protein [Ignavibacteria bacterium]|nr:MAG: polysaccharide deacetylase family protein [Ignavibacteria bacterium]